MRSLILSAPADVPSAEIARRLAAAGITITAARVRQIRLEAGEHRGAGGGQATGAITYRPRASVRAQALLDQLVVDAATAGLEPEAYLERARRRT